MKYHSLFALALVFSVLLLSCTSQPKPSASTLPLSITQPSLAELKIAYGYDFSINPYLEPTSLLRGKPTEFVVLRFDFNLAQSAQVDLVATVDKAPGEDTAKLVDRDGLLQFWDMWETSDSSMNRRRTTIERSALPGVTFEARKGRYSYYLVLMGKNPLSRPGTIRATVYVDGYEPVGFEAPLPELPSKK